MKIIHFIPLLLVAETVSSIFAPEPLESENVYFKSECICRSGGQQHINNAIKKIQEDIERTRITENIPAIIAGISIKGKEVWSEAFGLTDIENDVKARKDSVWRMASISKTLTTTLVAKLVESGKIDLDESIHEYLKTDIFPVKQWNGKDVKITVKQLMSHSAGIRISKFPEDFEHIYSCNNVTQTLKEFKDEPLIFEPGTNFKYSNYGWQIIGAIIESVLNETYEKAINKMFVNELGMKSTYAERRDMIIPHRAHYYMKHNNYSTNGKLIKADITDDLVSVGCGWPAAGIVSTVGDLLKFGNYMLSSYKGKTDVKSGFLKSSTVRRLWTPYYSLPSNWNNNQTSYGMGWFVTNLTQPIGCCKTLAIKYLVWHSGGMRGLKNSIAIFPEQEFVVVGLSNLGALEPIKEQIKALVLRIAANFL